MESNGYTRKNNAYGEVEIYKEGLVSEGYKQKHDIDSEEVYALVARVETICLFGSIDKVENQSS